MELNLTKPIVFFDIEATGLNVASDRIVEISMLKIAPGKEDELKTYRVNPTIPISKDAQRVHGISDDDVKDEQTFSDIAKEVIDFLRGCDLAGYNSTKFDVPMLMEEILRADVEFDIRKSKLVDVQVIFFKKEPRNLAAAYKFYCNKELENAHSADADTIATYEVLKAQLEKYTDLGNDINGLAKFSTQSNFADFAGRFVYDNKNNVVINFGKHKGKQLMKVLKDEPGYYSWIMGGEFPLFTKRLVTQVKLSMAFSNTNMK